MPALMAVSAAVSAFDTLVARPPTDVISGHPLVANTPFGKPVWRMPLQGRAVHPLARMAFVSRACARHKR